MSEALCQCGHAEGAHNPKITKPIFCQGSPTCTCVVYTPPPTREPIRLTDEERAISVILHEHHWQGGRDSSDSGCACGWKQSPVNTRHPNHVARVIAAYFADLIQRAERAERQVAGAKRINETLAESGRAADRQILRLNSELAAARLAGGPTLAITDGMVEAAAEASHDAYEEAAILHGWETQKRSRKPWADVPEENKATVRDAIRAALKAALAYRTPESEEGE